MISPNAPLSVDDTLIATDRETHEGPYFIHIYQRSDGTFLIIWYTSEVRDDGMHKRTVELRRRPYVEFPEKIERWYEDTRIKSKKGNDNGDMRLARVSTGEYLDPLPVGSRIALPSDRRYVPENVYERSDGREAS